ncbi:MAG: pentapeptide repeat-containing protein [Gammaproteobacteria bacterium]|nr:pentapeptide repeat-containing protein [Gammaproteobacteria bacterium]NIR98116.1 pentapeptide repeat-containing protein [Gammaproteobacteria bacterium]NIT63808.1 pentapeptide repeat-containing protein [Gammaproteobacteria bacterium]NIV20758.1 pentapeptide repeat-containing protein [Gammaproteobacteria bacterium]NIY32388.1 pentapeptide repeat-containing protein [Gammaproteobacteria bacterium]
MGERQETHSHLWYTRKNGEVKGPFPLKMVRRFVLLGRLTLEDQASADAQHWQRIAELPVLIPAEVLEADTEEGRQRLMMARIREDERRGDRRTGEAAAPTDADRRTGRERREPEPGLLVGHRMLRHRLAARDRTPEGRLLPVLILIGLLAALAGGWWYLQQRVPLASDAAPACGAPAAPGVNWSNCKLEGVQAHGADLRRARIGNADLRGADLRGANLRGANLAYTNLSTADISYADLGGASLKGAGLRNADLSYARLHGADLSFADLRGANLGGAELADVRLGKAIWLDGRECARGSLGGCR